MKIGRLPTQAVLAAQAVLALLAWLAAADLLAAAEPEAAGFTGCHAERLPEGTAETTRVDSQNAHRFFAPASVAKLVTVAAALEVLGPDHRVDTSVVLGRGGDLVIRAAADPTWSERFFPDDARAPLRRLAGDVASALRRRGLERLGGDLVVDLSGFPGRPFPPSRAVSEVAYAYGAPATGLAVDENSVVLEIAPGSAVGAPATARWIEPRVAVYELDNRTTTAPPSRHEKGTFDALPSWRGDTLVLRGEYPISEPPYRLRLAVHDGEERAARAFRLLLAAEGVEIAGGVRISTTPVPAIGEALGRVVSPPLRQWLPAILGESENWLAEMLLRGAAGELLGEGRTADGAAALVELLEDRAGLPPGEILLEDGSGLSPYDRVTPRAVVALLRWARDRPWADAYFAALATPAAPGRAARGTLRAWPPLPPGLRAKTGTLRHTVSLAGVLPTRHGEIVFACFYAHHPAERRELRRELAARIRSWTRDDL